MNLNLGTAGSANRNARRLEARKVKSREVQACFALLQTVGRWLEEQGRVQRVAKLPLTTYQRWQLAGVNYLMTFDGELAGIFSLPQEMFEAWPHEQQRGRVTWLRTLATHPNFRGHGVGRFAVRAALQRYASGRPLYLDCVSGFLPEFYQSLGFRTLAQQQLTQANGAVLPVTLMWHPNQA